MDENEFDSLRPWCPFPIDEFQRAQVQFGRLTVLAKALWGDTLDYLERQLIAQYPEIPPNCTVPDLRKLLHLASLLNQPRTKSVFPLRSSSQPIVVGIQRFTTWEARCEIVRRAIEFLENPLR